MAIDIGTEAIGRPSTMSIASTRIIVDNPANADGTIDTWLMWLNEDGADVEVATFYVVSGTNFSTRDSEAIGAVSSGSLQTFSGLSTNVLTGDYAGIYGTAGKIELTTDAGNSHWWKAGDQIPCIDAEFALFTYYTNNTMSLYGTGEEEAPPAGHPTMKRWGGIPYMEPRGRGVW